MCKYTLCVIGLLTFTLYILSADLSVSPKRRCGGKLNNLHLARSLHDRHCVIVGTHDYKPNWCIHFGLSAGLLKCRKTILKQNKLTLMYICFILIMLASDTESNPGPNSNDKCGICTKVVQWDPDRGIFCEECDTWFYAECQGMSSFMYQFHSDHPDEQ